MKNPTYVVIMAGGIGSRFWPVSRTSYPKQFHDILGVGRTMLQETVRRFADVCPIENFFVVTNAEYVPLVREQIPEVPLDNILGEPDRKNTAPCLAYAAHKIAQKSPKATLIVTPSDALILDTETFVSKIKMAMAATVNCSKIVTIGIQPTRPDTNYGYIRFRNDSSGDEVCAVEKFTEKPDPETAKSFYESGDYAWNAGIFVWNVQTILKNMEQYLPQVDALIRQAGESFYTENEEASIKKAYALCDSVSIDYGIMEHAQEVFVIPCHCGWSDLGTWRALYEVFEKDDSDNALQGTHLLFETKNSMFKTPKERLVVAQGLDGYLVAEHDNVLLICKREEEHRIKAFLEAAQNKDTSFG